MFILKKMALFCWDVYNENMTKVVGDIIETDDEGPSKEWGMWFRHPIQKDIEKAKLL